MAHAVPSKFDKPAPTRDTYVPAGTSYRACPPAEVNA